MPRRYGKTETTINLTKKFSGKLNLDAGCGDARYAPYFTGELVGLDVDSQILKVAKKRARAAQGILTPIYR